MLLKDVAEVIFSFPERANENNKQSKRLAVASCFKENNEVVDIKEDLEFILDENLKVQNGDIVVRRIQPQFVNYISGDTNYYIGQNLMVIRGKDNINKKYLAYIIETNIKSLYTETTGSVIPAVKRKDLDEFNIGELPEQHIQQAIGELWWLNKEKIKLRQQLNKIETIKLENELLNLRRKHYDIF